MTIKDGYLRGEDWSDDAPGFDEYGNFISGHDAQGHPVIDNALYQQLQAEGRAPAPPEPGDPYDPRQQ
jgi:hypothetical protein